MELIQNIVEYYDELYPVEDLQKQFYSELFSTYAKPVKILDIGCGTGTFEHNLAKEGIDVTGLETSREMLESANRKRRNQLMSVRFFQMSTIEMTRFLGKHFYNIISCLNNRVVFIHDQTLMRKFFFDCRELLSDKGTLVLELYNYDKFNAEPMAKLPLRSSIRSHLYTQMWTKDDGGKYIQEDLETGNGKMIPIIEESLIYPLRNHEIEKFAKEAGFKHIDFYSSFDKQEFTDKSETLICVIQ